MSGISSRLNPGILEIPRVSRATTIRTLAFLVLVSIVAGCRAADSAETKAPLVINAMPAFWAFQDQIDSTTAPDEAVRLFRQAVIEPHRAIYSKEQFEKHITDERIAAYLEKVEPDLEVMRALSAQIEQQTRTASERFRQTFPGFDGNVLTAYLPSFYSFDGQSTLIDGEHALLFGLDGIAKFHGANADLGVLFTHELFHIHHARTTPSLFADEENAPLFMNVWIEGLATYVSDRLHPHASTLQIMLDDKALLDRGMPLVGEIAEMILARLDSEAREDKGRFLSYGDKGAIPGRSGYLIGYLAARNLGERFDLQELTALEGEHLRDLLRDALSQLAAKFTHKL
jgi:hypothetical protein